MAEWYKLYISDWNDGTSVLSLELEGAYLRVVNAIRQTDIPVRHDLFVLGGLWRCNDRKAKRILSDLISAGKLTLEDGKISNRRAVDDASTLRRQRTDRASAGRRGGVRSGKSRGKSLKDNEQEDFLLEPEKNRAFASPIGSQTDNKKEPPAARACHSEPDQNAQAFEIFQAMAQRAKLPVPAKLSNARKSKLKNRLKDCGGVEGWKIACSKVEASNFCTGDNKHGWLAGLDFMLQESSFNKIMEGSYDNRTHNNGHTPIGARVAGSATPTEIADRATRITQRQEAERRAGADVGKGQYESG